MSEALGRNRRAKRRHLAAQLGGELGPVRVDEQPAVRKRLIDPATVGAGCSGGHPEWRTCERCRP